MKSLILPFSPWKEKTFHELYNKYYKALVNYAMQMLGEQAMAEDVVQDTFVQLWQQGSRERSTIHIRAFLYNVTHNAAIDRLRHNKVENDYRHHYEEVVSDDDESLFSEEVFRQLFEEIDRLPKRQREVFLELMKGRKNREIAQSLQIAEQTVMKLRQRGMNTLRTRMNGKSDLLLLFLFP